MEKAFHHGVSRSRSSASGGSAKLPLSDADAGVQGARVPLSQQVAICVSRWHQQLPEFGAVSLAEMHRWARKLYFHPHRPRCAAAQPYFLCTVRPGFSGTIAIPTGGGSSRQRAGRRGMTLRSRLDSARTPPRMPTAPLGKQRLGTTERVGQEDEGTDSLQQQLPRSGASVELRRAARQLLLLGRPTGRELARCRQQPAARRPTVTTLAHS